MRTNAKWDPVLDPEPKGKIGTKDMLGQLVKLEYGMKIIVLN